MPEHQQTNQSKESKSTAQKQATPRIQAPISHPMAIIQRARINPKSLTHADVLQLQQTIGNRAVGRLLSEIGLIPSKSKQTQPVQMQTINEKEEKSLQGKFAEPIQCQEIPEEEEPLQGKMVESIQRQEIPEEEEPLQGKFERKSEQETCLSCSTFPIQREKENRTGMPNNVKVGVENLSGIDMNDVRVHYNSDKPAEVGALAYTQGTNIHVAPGQERHLPHEAWHVVQQKQGRVRPNMQIKGLAMNDDKGLEQEADIMGNQVRYQLKPQTLNDLRQSGVAPHELININETFLPVIQCMTMKEYVDRVIIAAKAKKRWSDDFLELLSSIDKKFYETNVKDDSEAAQFLTSQSITYIGKFKKLDDLIHYMMGTRKTAVGLSSIRDLRIEGEQIKGRPDFAKPVKEYLPTAPTQHRRHITAWHTMREFFNMVLKKINVAMLKKSLELAPSSVVKEATELINKAPPAIFGTLDPEAGKTIFITLFVMNSNPNNLWVGCGKENSLINTASGVIKNGISSIVSIENAKDQAKEWGDVDGDDIISESKILASEIIFNFIEEVQNHKDRDEKREVEELKRRVLSWVDATLEIDVITGSKATTQGILTGRTDIVEAAKRFYSVVNGLSDVKALDIRQINEIIETLLKYPKEFK